MPRDQPLRTVFAVDSKSPIRLKTPNAPNAQQPRLNPTPGAQTGSPSERTKSDPEIL